MLLLREITESEVPKDAHMPCGIFPEGTADKASPSDSCAPQAVFLCHCKDNRQPAQENKETKATDIDLLLLSLCAVSPGFNLRASTLTFPCRGGGAVTFAVSLDYNNK